MSRACLACRRRKTRCNREAPCSNCVRSRGNEACVYEEGPLRPRLARHEHSPSVRGHEGNSPPSQEVLLPSPRASTTSSAPAFSQLAVPPESTVPSSIGNADSMPTHDIAFLRSRVKYLEDKIEKASHAPAIASSTLPSMQLRIRQLEEQLCKASPSSVSTCPSSVHTSATDIETRTSQIGGTFHIHHPSSSVTEARAEAGAVHKAQAISRNISHKTRLFGQSHWVNTIAPLVCVYCLRCSLCFM